MLAFVSRFKKKKSSLFFYSPPLNKIGENKIPAAFYSVENFFFFFLPEAFNVERERKKIEKKIGQES